MTKLRALFTNIKIAVSKIAHTLREYEVLIFLISVIGISIFNWRLLKVTEKTAYTAYKTLTLTHYSIVDVDYLSHDFSDPHIPINFRISSNLPTKIVSVKSHYYKLSKQGFELKEEYDPDLHIRGENSTQHSIRNNFIGHTSEDVAIIRIILNTGDTYEFTTPIGIDIEYQDAASGEIGITTTWFHITTHPSRGAICFSRGDSIIVEEGYEINSRLSEIWHWSPCESRYLKSQ